MFLQLVFTTLLGTLSVIAPLALLPFFVFKFRIYTFDKSHDVAIIKRKLKPNSLILRNNVDPLSFSCGKWYIAYVGTTPGTQNNQSTDYVYLFSTIKTKEALLIDADSIKKEDITQEHITKISTLVKGYGAWWGYDYSQMDEYVVNHTLYDSQEYVINEILDHYNDPENYLHNTIVFINGEPGSGKSEIGDILAAKLKDSILCDTYNPQLAGDGFNNMYQTYQKTGKKHLILRIDEVDGIVRTIENNSHSLVGNSKYFVQVTNKSGWNSFLDNLTKRRVNLIVLLTSNTPYEEISLDKSYLREGRTHLRFRMNKNSYCKLS